MLGDFQRAIRTAVIAVSVILLLITPVCTFAALKNPLVYGSSIDLYPYASLHAERGSTFWKNKVYVSSWPTDGNYNPLLVVDVSNPNNPTFVGRFGGNDAYWNQIMPFEDKLFVAGWGTMFKLYDISNPAQTTFVGQYDRPDEPNPGGGMAFKYFGWGVDASNDRAYITEGSEQTRGWYIIDVSNPNNPTLVSKYELPEGPAGIAVKGSYLYSGFNHHGSVPAANDFRFCVVNISDETAPQIIKQFTGMPGSVGGIKLRDNVAYVQCAGLISYDISDPTNPVELDRIDCTGGEMILLGDYAIIATGGNAVQFVNIANPSNMYMAAYAQSPSPINQFEESVCGNGRYVYVGTATDAGQLDRLPPPYTGIPQTKLFTLEVFDTDPDNAGPGNWKNYSLAEASWDTQYDGTELPSESVQSWQILEGDETTSTIESGALHVNDNSAKKIKWWRGWDATNTRGTTVLVKARCASNSPIGSEIPNLMIEDGKYSEEFSILSDRIRANNANIECPVTGTLWHVYRITTKGNQFNVYVDEAAAPALTGTLSTTTTKSRIMFGSGSTASSQSIYFDSLQCFSNGAFPPSIRTNDQTPDLSVAVSDVAGKGSLSGIDPSTAAAQWSTDGGNTWYPRLWDCRYEGTSLPTASSPAWSVPEGTESLASLDADGVLVNDNLTTAKLKWSRSWNAIPSVGTTVLTRARCESVGGDTTYTGNIYVEDGAYSVWFKITNTQIVSSEPGKSYNLDGTQWHTYRVTAKSGLYDVYLDENSTPIISGTMDPSTSDNRVMFGSGSTLGTQHIHFDYFYYTTLGDFVPGSGGGGAATVTCTGQAGTDRGVITAYGVPFNQYSETDNKIRFLLKDMMGNVGVSPTYNVRISEDAGPKVVNVTSTQNGLLKVNNLIYIDVTFSSDVYITGSMPKLGLETGAVKQKAIYQTGNGSDTLRFLYQVQPGDTTPHLDYTTMNALEVPGTMKDVNGSSADIRLPAPGEAGSLGANANIAIDGIAPRVSNVTALSDGAYKAGSLVDIWVDFLEPVTVANGTPTLELETGTTDRKASYLSGSGTTRLVFRYTVEQGDISADLNYKATNSLATNGAALRDGAGNVSVNTLPALTALTSLASNRDIVIDTTAPGASSATPISGVYSESVSVTLSAETGCRIRYTTDGTEPTASSNLYENPIELTADTLLRFFALDAAGNEEATKHQESYVVLSTNGSIADAKLKWFGEVRLGEKILYYKSGSVGYIEESDRFAGMRIEGNISANEGSLVNLIGYISQTPTGEKFISITTITPDGTGSVRALGANNRAAKLSVMDGLLTTVWGIVAPNPGANYFYLSDGSGSEGIKIITPGAPGVTAGSFVTVTGPAGREIGRRVIYKK